MKISFHRVNKAGGIHGRKIELISHDDAYECGIPQPLLELLCTYGPFYRVRQAVRARWGEREYRPWPFRRPRPRRPPPRPHRRAARSYGGTSTSPTAPIGRLSRRLEGRHTHGAAAPG
ncbi:hypothetical protein [Variovorax sp. LjRoot178]|uniref:hypothetical protein n=1 Tax=Variovorax sp. LjRoot178 TaxID=3342277 RepID=UPI003F51346F